MSCGPGTLFNRNRGLCDYPQNVNCIRPTAPPPPAPPRPRSPPPPPPPTTTQKPRECMNAWEFIGKVFTQGIRF